MIPVAPIVDYMDRHGLDVCDLFPQESVERATGNGATFERQVVLRECVPAMEIWRRRMWRARARGVIDPFVADEFCCHLLRMHPAALYGRDWFEHEAVAA